MGRTTRWLRSLLRGKKEAKISREIGDEKREKKRWSFKAGRESADIGNNQNIPIMPPVEDGAKWLRTFYSESEKEQNKHAIAVAAATAAAADAAVAAAQAAVAVVRLTGKGRAEVFQQRFAAIKIQTVFRGYLAKKALRALKALVKLQALVRGYLVRKQAAATLQSMQALIRAQSTIRAQKCRNLLANDRWFQPEFVPRKSLERFEEASHSRRLSSNLDSTSNGYDRSPKIVEIDTCRSKSRSSRSRTSASLIDSIEEMTLNSIPSRISIPDCRNFQEYDWCRFSATAQSTPRYMNSNGIAPATPAKSVCAGDCPNYMTNTRSFEAKVRSQSAPRQRPEPFGPRKRLPLSEVLLESRASLSGVGMQRSCNRIQEAFNFKSAVLDRLDRSVEFGRGSEQELHLQGKW